MAKHELALLLLYPAVARIVLRFLMNWISIKSIKSKIPQVLRDNPVKYSAAGERLP